eukprot:CAMPEP_0201547352 /NCGR_PEP_ID=MMETSP0173_2-20130828/3836_1 /ASSEMBLY_ACC=CAM_ASM_000268 /TAXON_ID=218659 /ORGANISM="Vexillifera sp., Strain DIVA3 564/2" /LENGTH=31 /DNA_ID= /DNA_START= /DNA_END= /DNA_ORIENTATION=
MTATTLKSLEALEKIANGVDHVIIENRQYSI